MKFSKTAMYEVAYTHGLFVIPKANTLKTKPSFVGMMGLYTGFSEGKDYNLEMCGGRDHLDVNG